jgi:hypothetical protein
MMRCDCDQCKRGESWWGNVVWNVVVGLILLAGLILGPHAIDALIKGM